MDSTADLWVAPTYGDYNNGARVICEARYDEIEEYARTVSDVTEEEIDRGHQFIADAYDVWNGDKEIEPASFAFTVLLHQCTVWKCELR